MPRGCRCRRRRAWWTTSFHPRRHRPRLHRSRRHRLQPRRRRAKRRKEFPGFENDIESIGDFMRLWTHPQRALGSPKFLAGESYGTTRAAGLACFLQERYGMDLNGLVLISAVLNWQTSCSPRQRHAVHHVPAHLRRHRLVPQEAAAPSSAARPARRARRGGSLRARRVRPGAAPGRPLPAAERHDIADRVARYTGLSVDYVERSRPADRARAFRQGAAARPGEDDRPARHPLHRPRPRRRRRGLRIRSQPEPGRTVPTPPR